MCSKNDKQFESSLSSSTNLSENCVKTTNNVINITIGSRRSKLAVIQTESVIKELTEIYGQNRYNFSMKTMTTTGDNILNIPLSKIGEKALFTRELEDELMDNKIDLIVHSLKDLPTSLPNGCTIAVITKREDPSDAIVLKSGLHLDNAFDILCDSKSGTIGTSSLRRIAQLKQLNPEIKTEDIRGNLNTRLAKLDNQKSGYSALILASAGLKRADFSHRISQRLTENWYYAVGQGALAIETRADDTFILHLLKPLIDLKTTYECLAERTFMQALEGGCSVPIGVKCKWNAGARYDYSDNHCVLTLDGIVLSLDGRTKVQNEITIDLNEKLLKDDINSSSCPFNYTALAINQIDDEIVMNRIKNSAILGYELAQSLLQLGAKHILNNIKH